MKPGLLVEAFPAAQLKIWNLPYQGYNGAAPSARNERIDIINSLSRRVSLGSYRTTLDDNADALDAVVAAFGAVADTEGLLAIPPGAQAPKEGWIAMHV